MQVWLHSNSADSLDITIRHGQNAVDIGPDVVRTQIDGEQLADVDEQLKRMKRALTIESTASDNRVFATSGEDS